MTRLLVTACAALAASCTRELTNEPVIPTQVTSGAARTAGGPSSWWRSEICRINPGDEGPTDSAKTLTFAGECNFPHRTPAQCYSRGDDYYVAAQRTLAGGQTLTFFANIESYSGPGEYKIAEIHLTVRDGERIYRWSNTHGAATVAGGEKPIVEFPDVTLEAVAGTPAAGSIALKGAIGCVP